MIDDIVNSSSKELFSINFKVHSQTHFPKLKYLVRNEYFTSLKIKDMKCLNYKYTCSYLELFGSTKKTLVFPSALHIRTANATIMPVLKKIIAIPNKSHNYRRE